jgi:hypothetical protein
MQDKIALYQQTGYKAVQFQLQYQQPDGGYIWEGYANDAYHKQAYSWAIAGHVAEAHRLLNWVRDNTQLTDGELQHYNGDLYKYSWFFQGAHRLGRFDLSHPAMQFLLSCQAPCGGFPWRTDAPYVQSGSTCWTGISALYFGQLQVARQAAEWAISLLHQQPEEGRFYFLTTRYGELVTPQTTPEADALHIDVTLPKQWHWEVGLPLQLMCRMYMATGMSKYLDYAWRFFEFMQSCYDDAFGWAGSGKSSLGAALLYQITGDKRPMQATMAFADFLVETQYPEGGWRDETEPDELLIYIDHAAEFNIWLQELAACLASRA